MKRLLCLFRNIQQEHKRTGWRLLPSKPEFSSLLIAQRGFFCGWKQDEDLRRFSFHFYRFAASLYSLQSIQYTVLMRVQPYPFFFIGIADHFCYCGPRLCVFQMELFSSVIGKYVDHNDTPIKKTKPHRLTAVSIMHTIDRTRSLIRWQENAFANTCEKIFNSRFLLIKVNSCAATTSEKFRNMKAEVQKNLLNRSLFSYTFYSFTCLLHNMRRNVGSLLNK